MHHGFAGQFNSVSFNPPGENTVRTKLPFKQEETANKGDLSSNWQFNKCRAFKIYF